MNFRKRLRFYLVGVAIGVLLAFVIFDGRGCEWLPSHRVLDAIKNSKIVISEADACIVQCENISKDKIYDLIEQGEVHFGDSDVRNRDYKITFNGLSLFIKISDLDTTSYVHGIDYSGKCDSCMEKDSNQYVLLYKPNDLVLKKLRSLTPSIKKDALCEFDCFGLSKEVTDEVLKDGEILFNESFPNRKPNPLFYIKKKIGAKEFLFEVEQGASKVRFLHVVLYRPSLLRKGDPLSLLYQISNELKDCGCNN